MDKITKRLEELVSRMERLPLREFLCLQRDWKRRLFSEFLNGIVRGLGFSIGFTVLGALVLYLLKGIALSNLPLIGRFLAELVHIVENNL